MKHKVVYFALLIGLLWQDVCHSLVIRNFNDKQVSVGDKVELQCGLRFSASSEIMWRKLIGRLSDESEETDGKLIIHGVVRQDDGEYECSNVEGQKQLLRLIVLDSGTTANKNARYVPVVKADVGSTVELRCEFTNMPTLAWKRQNGEISKYKTVYNAPDNRLALHYLTEEDSGIYVCESENGKRSTVTLKVKPFQGDNVNQQRHGSFGLDDNEFYKVISKQVGSFALLECDLGQNTFSEGDGIQWKKNFGVISENSRMWDNKLEINSLKVEDSGVYECFMDNSDSLKFNLIVKPIQHQANLDAPNRMFQNKESEDNNEPEHEKQPNQEPNPANNGRVNVDFYMVKNVNSSAELKCNLFANNYYNLDWRKLYGEIPIQRSNAVENVLTINNLVKGDSGMYECSLDSGVFYRIKLDVIDEQDNNTDVNKTQVQHNAGYSWSWSWSSSSSSSSSQQSSNSRRQNQVANTQARQSQSPSRYIRQQEETQHYEPTPEYQEPAGCNELEATCANGQCVHGSAFCDGNSDCEDGSDESNCQRPQPTGCNEYEATCANGECISKSALCNGYTDCSDGSDESNCGSSRPGECQPNEVSCRNKGKCIPKIWLCDGESECSDNSDEDSCGSYRPGEMCKTTEHKCSSGNQCVAKSFLCDDELDCKDGSDEYGCAPPKVTRTPVRRIVIGVGESFKIECTATGFPIPYINWRLNWGHTCDGPRCCATSENGHGILIVTNVQYSDAGAYSCEAINSKGREFAIPDAIVEVVNRRTMDGYNYYNCTHQEPIKITTTTTTTTTTRTTTVYTEPKYNECNYYYCYNHTDQCTCSNICYDCKHNTEGDRCERCKWPYIGDATRGTPYDCYLPDHPAPLVTTSPMTTKTYPGPTVLPGDPSCAEDCHFHSNNCTCSTCVNCDHNTTGRYCEQCLPGFTGNAKEGTPYDCQPIPGYVPTEIQDRRYRPYRDHSATYSETNDRMYRPDRGSSSTNSEIEDRMYRPDRGSSSTNSEIEDRMYRPDRESSSTNSEIEVVEDNTNNWENKPPEVSNTESSSNDQSGNESPDYYSEYLHAPKEVKKCNAFGTLQIVDGICKCKAGVVGTHCEQCAPSFFHMMPKKDYKRGCLSCFCNGQNVDCTSSELSYGIVRANFDSESSDWYVSDRFLELEHLPFDNVDDRSVEFTKFEEFRNSELFVLVPQKFKGNKLGSFGGNLSFKLTVNDESNPDRTEIKPVEIRISGSRVNIIHRGELPVNINEDNHITINIFEDQFKRYGDNGKVDRDHLMMVLSDIKTIMIRASYTPNQYSIKISDFELDVAGEANAQSNDDHRQAKMVEVCSCPTGYTGNSCESCASGYERSTRGFYLGQCEPSTRK